MKGIIVGTSTEKIIPFPGGVQTEETKFGPVDYLFDGNVYVVLRHRKGHSVAPGKINYLANVEFLRSKGVDEVISTYAVGSITHKLPPLMIGLVSDFLDFTGGRQSTFFDGIIGPVKHVEVGSLFQNDLKDRVLETAKEEKIFLVPDLIYVTTNGPRLESPAEIRAYGALGADIVGMTMNPEVTLLHEVGIKVQGLGFSINWAAGIDRGGFSFVSDEEEEQLSKSVFELAYKTLTR